jgi:hypothetical protein
LCGVFGAEAHWTDGDGRAGTPEGGAVSWTRRQERLRRVAIGNKVLAGYGLKLSDWQGSAYVLRNRTGRSQILPHLAALWPAAEALAGRACDPLDSETVAAVEALGAPSRQRT